MANFAINILSTYCMDSHLEIIYRNAFRINYLTLPELPSFGINFCFALLQLDLFGINTVSNSEWIVPRKNYLR